MSIFGGRLRGVMQIVISV